MFDDLKDILFEQLVIQVLTGLEISTGSRPVNMNCNLPEWQVEIFSSRILSFIFSLILLNILHCKCRIASRLQQCRVLFHITIKND